MMRLFQRPQFGATMFAQDEAAALAMQSVKYTPRAEIAIGNLQVPWLGPALHRCVNVHSCAGPSTHGTKSTTNIAFLSGAITLPGVLKTDLGACTLEWMGGPSIMHDGDLRSLTAADIARLPIITLSQEANSHAVMVNWFEQAGVKPTRVHYCNSSSVVASLVRKGVGISLFASDYFRTMC